MASLPRTPKPRRRTTISDFIRNDQVTGALLILAAVAALTLANSQLSAVYHAVRDYELGPESLRLNMNLGAWASDGLLTVFFFVVGLELKHEFVSGKLRHVREAALPVLAAVGGVAMPALIYLAMVRADTAAVSGWAIPTATDIAFAVGVLAVVAPRLPSALRVFLLTLAVVDDLIAIVIIALVYTESIAFAPLFFACAAVAVYGIVVRRFQPMFLGSALAAGVILLPIAVIAWACMHASGVHATIAGVLLAFSVPARVSRPGEVPLVTLFAHRLSPLSNVLALPLFAFFAAGVTVGKMSGLHDAISAPVTLAIVLALVIGKPLGIMLTTWLYLRLSGSRLDSSYRWIDLVGVAMLAGVGFTVSLLLSDLSFGLHSEMAEQAKLAVLCASVLAAAGASVVLGVRNVHYRNRRS